VSVSVDGKSRASIYLLDLKSVFAEGCESVVQQSVDVLETQTLLAREAAELSDTYLSFLRAFGVCQLLCTLLRIKSICKCILQHCHSTGLAHIREKVHWCIVFDVGGIDLVVGHDDSEIAVLSKHRGLRIEALILD